MQSRGLSSPEMTECWLTGDRSRDDGHIYESILSLLICDSHFVSDGLDPLFKSIRKALVPFVFAIQKAPYWKVKASQEPWVLRLLVLDQ